MQLNATRSKIVWDLKIPCYIFNLSIAPKHLIFYKIMFSWTLLKFCCLRPPGCTRSFTYEHTFQLRTILQGTINWLVPRNTKEKKRKEYCAKHSWTWCLFSTKHKNKWTKSAFVYFPLQLGSHGAFICSLKKAENNSKKICYKYSPEVSTQCH